MRESAGTFPSVAEAPVDSGQGRLVRELHEARSAETVGRFAVSIAHDFNSLCTALIYFAEVANSCVQSGGDPSTVIGHIAQTAQSASELSRQILSFTREQLADPVRLDVDGAVAELTPLLECLVGPERALDVATAESGARIEMAPTHLRQILLNLLVNAHDATTSGGRITIATDVVDIGAVECDLTRGALPAGRYAALVVSDSGAGMDDRTLARCFEPFFTTKGMGRGSGIGLATVRDLAEQYGGSVVASSAPGAGSTFTVYLPAV
jgi:two-component system, cell cycle sensor histidine kinase and response regulator CckA